MGLLGNVIIFTIFYRENIFQFQITLDFELYLFFCSGCLCIVHKLFLPSDDSLYKVLHYAGHWCHLKVILSDFGFPSLEMCSQV